MDGLHLTFRQNPMMMVKVCKYQPSLLVRIAVITFDSKPVHAYVIQVVVLANHMNGKDTHVRGLRVLGPLE